MNTATCNKKETVLTRKF